MKRLSSAFGSVPAVLVLGLVSMGVFLFGVQSWATEYRVTITQPPQDVTVCEGQTVTLTVQATTNYPNPQYGFQWLYNNTPISDNSTYSGSTTNTLVISNISQNEGGQYTVVVSVTNGTVIPATAVVQVTVVPAPTIQQQPQDVTVCEGQIAAMSVQVSGGLNVTYQWYANATAVPGATTSSISQTATAQMNGLQVYCRITSDCGAINSNTATLTVQTAPVITQQPQGGTANVGGSFQLNVQAQGNNLQYQWFKNNQPISGATSSTYTISNITANDAGNYKVTVTNNCGTVESSVITITVASIEEETLAAGYRLHLNPQPANDNITIVVTTPTTEAVSIDLLDVNGRTVGTVWSGIIAGSEQKINASVSTVAAGLYRCVLRSGGYRLSVPLVIVR
ncbi:MAG: immunoglobulin domain-containing protein [Chlorobi bacterium]|nr:immunoglobulin domain-containing protein [Chlorobiota bacterium]